MRHLFISISVISIIVLISTTSALCQTFSEKYSFEKDVKYKIETYSDYAYIGKVIETDSTAITIIEYGYLKERIPYFRIQKIERLDSVKVKRLAAWGINSDASRYLFAPSAITLKKGDFYYQNTYLLINSIYAGISDHITIGAGIELQFLMMSQDGIAPSFFITANTGYQISENLHVGGGFMFINTLMPNSTKRSNGAYAYGLGTYGNKNHNITMGLGWGVFKNEFRNKPYLNLSAMTRIGKRTAFIAENWFLPFDKYEVYYSGGLRIFGQRASVDIALIYIQDNKESLISVIPYIDLVIRF